ncbi:methyltransferase [Nocardia nova SH22a]|uniref:Methyltransferase n=1 Tax=Nocardia nova SH22a TaxID=1415166 RepID=W5TE32_9NOCA|nr:class I SAM-dependent methyltransferase [Nocardia nova]AHH17399.1 methyltransferase [Nocardia nova SH22a]
MTENNPHATVPAPPDGHDYLPAAGRDALLPFYDLLTRVVGMPKIYDTLVGYAALRPGLRVLEIGSGTGNLTIRAKKAHPGIEAVGADPDPLALARAERKSRGLTGIRFERGYAQRLPFADGEFDRVLSSLMWHHLPDDIKAEAAQEIRRVLRPGGTLCLVDVAGHITAADGRSARRALHNAHLTGNLGNAIPERFAAAGMECTAIATTKLRLIGRITYYRATRPA